MVKGMFVRNADGPRAEYALHQQYGLDAATGERYHHSRAGGTTPLPRVCRRTVTMPVCQFGANEVRTGGVLFEFRWALCTPRLADGRGLD